ncbi:MAG: polysaccharide deacetylase family protein [Thaumarchaeota archaeon]|nr:polysaccharide deacetylase family protein [Nitrososphaerota archaeon]
MRFNWPSRFKGAVSLTFDDGLPSQLRLGVPLLERFGFKATFYINPGDGYENALKAWRDVADRGHEIGNHSVTHPCSCNFPGDPGCRGLENMTLEDIRLDIVKAHERIRSLIPNGSRTFAYPCYQTSVGRGLNKRSYVPIVAEIFLAARAYGERGYSNSPLACDLHELWSWPADRMRCEEMIGLTVKTVHEGRWAIFTFHGIDEGHLPVAYEDLSGFLRFLYERRDEIWVAPVMDVAEHVVGERKRLGIVF